MDHVCSWNKTFKHIINRISHKIFFFLCLFLRLCAWLRGTTEDLDSWREPCMLHFNNKKWGKCFHSQSDLGKQFYREVQQVTRNSFKMSLNCKQILEMKYSVSFSDCHILPSRPGCLPGMPSLKDSWGLTQTAGETGKNLLTAPAPGKPPSWEYSQGDFLFYFFEV